MARCPWTCDVMWCDVTSRRIPCLKRFNNSCFVPGHEQELQEVDGMVRKEIRRVSPDQRRLPQVRAQGEDSFCHHRLRQQLRVRAECGPFPQGEIRWPQGRSKDRLFEILLSSQLSNHRSKLDRCVGRPLAGRKATMDSTSSSRLHFVNSLWKMD